MTDPNAPDYDLLQRLRDRFYGMELHLVRLAPCTHDGNGGLDPAGEPRWYVMVNDALIQEPWVRAPDDKPDNFFARWFAKVNEQACKNTIERIERIKAVYAREVA